MVFVFGGRSYNDAIVDYAFIIFFSFNKTVARTNAIAKLTVFTAPEALRPACCQRSTVIVTGKLIVFVIN